MLTQGQLTLHKRGKAFGNLAGWFGKSKWKVLLGGF
jgi:hypothetical protein